MKPTPEAAANAQHGTALPSDTVLCASAGHVPRYPAHSHQHSPSEPVWVCTPLGWGESETAALAQLSPVSTESVAAPSHSLSGREGSSLRLPSPFPQKSAQQVQSPALC